MDPGHELASVEMLGKAGSDRPTSIRLLNLSIYMYIHIHELLDHALLAMHLALLEKRNLGRPPPAPDREGLRCPSDKGLAGPGTKSSH